MVSSHQPAECVRGRPSPCGKAGTQPRPVIRHSVAQVDRRRMRNNYAGATKLPVPAGGPDGIMRRRRSARLLIVVPAGRVLLFRFVFKNGALAGEDYWATPGGGVEEGETFE